MLEVSRVGVAESDDEIELSLDLSIGGSYGKLEKLKHVEGSGKESEKGLEAIVPRSGFSFPYTIVGDQVDTESGSGSEVGDSQRKLEIQTLRRQEARRKRDERLRKSAANYKGINGSAFCVGVAKANDKVWLEAQQLQTRGRDREMRENDAPLEDSARKKEKIAKCVANENGKDSNFTFRNDGTGSDDHGSGSKPAVSFLQNVPLTQMQGPYPQLQCVPLKNAPLEDSARKKEKIAKCVANENGNDSNFTFRNDGTGSDNHGSGSKPAVSFLQNVPLTQMQGPYPQLQCVPMKNGFVHSYMVPCRGPNVGKEGNETKGRNIFQPVTCGSFRPYPNGNLKHDSGTGCDSEHNSGKSGSGIQKVMSNGSLERTSSAISDYPSTSGRGGSSSETGSHSSCFRVNDQQFRVSAINDRIALPESSGSSYKKELGQVRRRSADKSPYGKVSGNVKPVASASKLEEPSTLRPTSGTEGTFISSLPQMPCVSTTGNGPKGKTITGFLDWYMKSEVSIVCVCHGSSFSPAEFVEHAGGTDITHPLRHITMISSSFGD